MTRLIFTLIAIVVFNSMKADVGPPTIQAVCKLKLKDGKIIEGLITLGYGSNDGIWTNGFYLECYQHIKYKYQQTEFLILVSISFTKVDSSYVFSQNHYKNCRKIKFLQWTRTPQFYDIRKLIYNDILTNDTLRLLTHIESTYLVLDSIKINFEIPSDTYLETFFDTSNNINFQKIALSEIDSFQLLDHPAQKWMDLISSANLKFDKLYGGEGSTGDFIPAVWYHELVLHKIEFERLQNIIVRNIDR